MSVFVCENSLLEYALWPDWYESALDIDTATYSSVINYYLPCDCYLKSMLFTPITYRPFNKLFSSATRLLLLNLCADFSRRYSFDLCVNRIQTVSILYSFKSNILLPVDISHPRSWQRYLALIPSRIIYNYCYLFALVDYCLALASCCTIKCDLTRSLWCIKLVA